MQTLRKKNSPCKLKNEPTRFLGEGVSFKAKLIGILEVSEARGDRMCQAALADLKMAIRAAGEHKQRITVQISIDGLRLRDEKNGDCLYHHPVHKISFIAQDMSDSRAFGYIFGSPDTGHRFFGIKTDKAASQVVIAMRDLFQVVFELKKKEIELAKQHIEHNVIRYSVSPDTKGAAGNEISLHRTASESERSRKQPQSGVVADLLDLQFELNSLRQGIHQMDKITPDNPRSGEDPFADPFGDSFVTMKIKEEIKPILPPPPSASKRSHIERQQTIQQTPTSGTSSPANIVNNNNNKTPPPQGPGSNKWFDKEAEELFNEGESSSTARKNSSSDEDKDINLSSLQQDRYKPLDIFSELDPLGTGIKKPYVDKKDFFQNLKNPPKKVLKDLASTNSEDTFPTNFNITLESLEADLKQMNESGSSQFEDGEFADFDKFKEKDVTTSEGRGSPKRSNRDSNKRTIQHQSLSVSLPPEETTHFKNSYGYMSGSMSSSYRYESVGKESENNQSLVKLPSPKKYLHSRKYGSSDHSDNHKSQSVDRSFPVDFSSTSESPASPLRSCSSGANSRLSSSSAEIENVPEPPPRGAASILINPPPLPPKKYSNRGGIKPPPRPPYGDGHFHYDFLEREEGSPSPTRTYKTRKNSSPRNLKDRFDDNFSPPIPQLPKRPDTSSSYSQSSFEDSFNSIIQSPKTALENSSSGKREINWANFTKDITVSQLTSTFFTDLADSLGMSVSDVTSLTLQQLAECIETLAKKETSTDNKDIFEKPSNTTKKIENTMNNFQSQSMKFESSFVSNEPLFKATFDQEPKEENSSTYDKYAVFRELLEMEQANNDLKTQKSSEEEEPATSENAEEPGDIDYDAQGDEVEEVMEKYLPVPSEGQSKEGSSYYEMKSSSENIESPRDNDMTPQEEMEPQEQYYELNNLNKDESYSDLTVTQDDKVEKESDEINEETKESSDNFVITAEEVNELSRIVDKKPESNASISNSSDKYAALREIIGETDESTTKNDNVTASPNKNSKVSTVEVDLQGLFTDNFCQQSTIITAKIVAKKEEDSKNNVMDIFEEIKMLNSDAHRTKDPKPTSSNLETIFNAFSDSKKDKEEGENWAKFESNLFSDKSSADGQGSVCGTSPWSPESKETNREPPLKKNVHRHSGESDNEWKDDESEESNGRNKGDIQPCCAAARHPRYDVPPFEGRPFYEESAEGDKERMFREKMCRKTRGAPWVKGGHRTREPLPWHEDPRWEEERRRHMHRHKVPYKDEEEYKAYWKCRSKQRPWNGEREGYWGPDHPFYDEECKRRMALWTEEERDRFSSQESMGYEDEERYFRREYDRRRMEEDNMFWRARGPDGEYVSREPYKKHDPHYFREGRDRHYDYPPSWEEEYGPKHPEDSPRYLTRKKHWPKRPNSANEGRDMMYMDMRNKCAMTRSECSDNDSDPYHRPYRSRSRESYWSSDQEFESWGERPYYSEGPDAKNESLHRKRMNRHRTRPQPKQQSSQFEDDFTQSIERGEVAIEPPNTEPRIRPEVEMKPPASPRSSTKEHGRREAKNYKSSSYFEDDLTPTASASSDTSDRQRLGSDLTVTLEESIKEQPADGFASEDSGRDSFFNGDPKFDDDAFAFRSEMDDQVPECATVPTKNSRLRYTSSRGKSDQYIKKSESVNIFSRENDPFDDDEFFN